MAEKAPALVCARTGAAANQRPAKNQRNRSEYHNCLPKILSVGLYSYPDFVSNLFRKSKYHITLPHHPWIQDLKSSSCNTSVFVFACFSGSTRRVQEWTATERTKTRAARYVVVAGDDFKARWRSHMTVEGSLVVPLRCGLEQPRLPQTCLESVHVDLQA